MYYVEFFKRRQGVALEEFHSTVQASFNYWEEHNPPDRLALLLARTWRLGPSPSCLAVWEIEDFQRLRTWEEAARVKRDRGAPNVADVAEMLQSGLYEAFGSEVQ